MIIRIIEFWGGEEMISAPPPPKKSWPGRGSPSGPGLVRGRRGCGLRPLSPPCEGGPPAARRRKEEGTNGVALPALPGEIIRGLRGSHLKVEVDRAAQGGSEDRYT